MKLYYADASNDEHVVVGKFLKPPHVAREDGYVGIEKRNERIVWIPWERIIRWETDLLQK